MSSLISQIISFLTGMGKVLEIINSYIRRRKRQKEIIAVDKETQQGHTEVEAGNIPELNKEFGWEEKK